MLYIDTVSIALVRQTLCGLPLIDGQHTLDLYRLIVFFPLFLLYWWVCCIMECNWCGFCHLMCCYMFLLDWFLKPAAFVNWRLFFCWWIIYVLLFVCELGTGVTELTWMKQHPFCQESTAVLRKDKASVWLFSFWRWCFALSLVLLNGWLGVRKNFWPVKIPQRP